MIGGNLRIRTSNYVIVTEPADVEKPEQSEGSHSITTVEHVVYDFLEVAPVQSINHR